MHYAHGKATQKKCKAREKKACGKTLKLAMERVLKNKISDRRARSAAKSNVHLNILYEINVCSLWYAEFSNLHFAMGKKPETVREWECGSKIDCGRVM